MFDVLTRKAKTFISHIQKGDIMSYIHQRFIWGFSCKCFYLVSGFISIRKNKIVCCSFGGVFNADNPRFIAQKLHELDPNLDIVWLVKNEICKDCVHEYIRIVPYRSVRALYELASAKVWIDNARKFFFPPKKRGQYYLQTWHGGLPIKQIEADVTDKLSTGYVKAAMRDAEAVDLMISDSKFLTDIYKRAFWNTGYILEYGLPRNDILINLTPEDKINMRKKLQLRDDTVYILYAPTFRNNHEDMSPYITDFSRLQDTFQKLTGKKVHFWVRYHPNVARIMELKDDDTVTNMSLYPDIQDLCIVSDYMISDYSSCVFDFALLKKPVFLYMCDYEAYTEERGFYLDMNNLPFDAAYSMDELCLNIENFDKGGYLRRLKEFFAEMGLNETGRSTEITARYILDKFLS